MAFGLLVAIIIIVVVAIVSTRGRDRPHGTDDDERSFRGVFVYSLALLGAALAASGAASLVRAAVEPLVGMDLVGSRARGFAFGLSLTIVGTPVWVLAWRGAQRAVATSTEEQRALPRRLYLAVVRAGSLAVAVPATIECLRWIAGIGVPDAGAVGRSLVWTAVWAYHEYVAASDVPFGGEDTQRVDRIEVYLVSASTLALLGGAVGALLGWSLSVVYELATPAPSLVRTDAAAIEPSIGAAIVAVVAGVVWWWHWTVVARHDRGSRPWAVYVFLVGILGGTATAIASGSVVVHRLLAWLIGASSAPAAAHFDDVPTAAAGSLVGLAVWGHHRAVLYEGGAHDPRPGGAERVYRYLLTAAGMLTAAVGAATVVMVGVDLAVPGRTVVTSPGGIRDAVAVGLTLLVIGLPVWARSWAWAQRRVREDTTERLSLPRRALIFGAFGLATVATITASSILLYELLDAILAGAFRPAVIAEQRWSIAVLLTAGAVAVHYGLVLREDRAARPEQRTGRRLREIILVAGDVSTLEGALRRRLDVRVIAWERADTAGIPWAEDLVDTVVERLGGTISRRALVLVGADGAVEVVPLGTD